MKNLILELFQQEPIILKTKSNIGMSWFVDNWLEIIGSTALSGAVGWFFGGKQAKRVELKKGNADATQSMADLYGTFLEDYKARMAEVMSELIEVKNHNKELQLQFNKIQLDYAREVERSQNWEKLHREMKTKYDALEKEYDEIKKENEKMRGEIDRLKKEFKKYESK